jgi:Ca-activated chloride channel homolog
VNSRSSFVLFLTAIAAAPISALAADTTFRSSSNVVSVYATVSDAHRRLVPDLTPRDFEVVDNGTPQPLTVFFREVQPFTLVTLLDTSASMTSNLPVLRRAAMALIAGLRPEDRALVGAFGDTVEFSDAFSSDHAELADAVQTLCPNGTTRLYDALLAGLDRLRGIGGRRVIVVFTDGEDTNSKASLKKVVARAAAEETMVYAIGLTKARVFGLKGAKVYDYDRIDQGLKRLAEETGGGYFEVGSADDLAPTFARVAEELHSQYVLGFEPAAFDGRTHTLHVRLLQPGMTARARRTYVAAQP